MIDTCNMILIYDIIELNIKKKMWYDCQWDNYPQKTKITQTLTTIGHRTPMNVFWTDSSSCFSLLFFFLQSKEGTSLNNTCFISHTPPYMLPWLDSKKWRLISCLFLVAVSLDFLYPRVHHGSHYWWRKLG